MEFIGLLTTIVFFIIYVQCDEFSDNKIILFLVNFIPYVLSFFLKYSIFYFKLISCIFVTFKTLFFVPILPMFLQYSLTIFVSFDFLWDAYLLLSVYSIVLICIPCYIFQFYFKKLSANYF